MAKRGAKRRPKSVEVEGREEQAAADSLPAALPRPVAAGLVFVAAGAVLVLEILAVRLLAPYVGLTLETTTSIIGAALAGIAGGAAVGGYFADRTNTRRLIVGLLIGGGLLTLLTVPVVHWLGPGARGEGDLPALGITLIALVPAAAVLSAVSPAVAHLQLHDLHASGTVVGRLSAWATAGALIGTFGTGFVLVPLMPVGTAVLVIGAVLVLVGIALGANSQVLSPAGIAGMAFVTLLLGAASATSSSPCDTETSYHCVRLEPDPSRPTGYDLLLDDGYHSYVDVEDPTYLKYPYVKWMARAIDGMDPGKSPLDVEFIGGGGFTLPRWLVATRPGSRANVLEVDGGLVDFAEERLGVRPSASLQVSVGDARIGLLNAKSDSADVVVGDAFGGDAVPWHLTTSEWTEEVRRVLKPDGLYALNLLDFQPLEFGRAEAATLLDAFANVKLVTYVYTSGDIYGGNLVLLASDQPIPESVNSREASVGNFGRGEVEVFATGAEPLRDDYAPVDQLLTTENEAGG
jgi:MFS family permease